MAEEKTDHVADTTIKIIRREIEIPIRVLTASDCEARWLLMPQCSKMTGRRIEFKVPVGSTPGCILDLPVKGGEVVEVVLPENATGGDMVYMMLREDGSWRVAKKTLEFSFMIRASAKVGERLRLKLPDASPVTFEVPEGIQPGELVTLKRNGVDGAGPWAFDRVDVLPPFAEGEEPESSRWVSGQYTSILKLIKDKGYLKKGLPLTENGKLQVTIPFCGRFQEYAVLGKYLAEHCGYMGISGAAVYGLEIVDRYKFDWAVAQSWYQQSYSNVSLELCEGDLAEDPLPDAGFTLGIHPEVTKGGVWFRIMGSLLRSGATGLCVFATFYECEKDTLLNMIDMFKNDGTIVDVIENPYYETHEMPTHAPMRFVIVVQGGLMKQSISSE